MSSDDAPSIYVEIDVHSTLASVMSFDATFGAIADQMPQHDGGPFADLAGDSAAQILTFCVTFDGAVTPDQALRDSLTIARDAIQASAVSIDGAWEFGRMTVVQTGDRLHLPVPA